MTEPGASHSAAGYGYQYERALYRILHSPNASTRFGIETADDVEQISKTESGSLRVSEQAKLVVKPRRNALQDASPNLWKTLRIWLRGLPAARVVHEHLEFVLVTNRPVKDGSLAKRLSNATDAVDVASVISALRAQAGEMTGKTGQIAAEVVAFNDGDLSYLIKRMQVHDSQDASALRKASIEALRLPEGAVEHSQKIYDGLIGFLFRQCQQKWERQEEFWTDAQPFYNQLYSLTQDCLNAPIEPLPLEETGFAKLMSEIHRDDMRFMHQLAQVELDDDMALTQFSYFCGAYSERVRLLATGNIQVSDFDKTERFLKDRWEAIRGKHRITARKKLDQFDKDDHLGVVSSTLYTEDFKIKIGRVEANQLYLHNGIYHRMVNGEGTYSAIHWHPQEEEGEQ